MPDLDLLRGLADEIVPPPFDALRETAQRRTRRAAAATVVAAAAAVALLVGVTFLAVTGDNRKPRPIRPPDVVDTTHPLTYAEGPKVHYGDKTVRAPGVVAEVDVTDAGVVVRTDDGRIWLTDGAGVDQIGTLGSPGNAYDVEDHPYATSWGFVVSDNTGARAAWLEFPSPGEPELVVYDTATRKETYRRALPASAGSYALLGSVTERYGYWYTSPETVESDVPLPQQRIELATGVRERVTRRAYAADTPGVGTPRTMLVSHAQGNEPVVYLVHDATAWQFDIGGGRVTPQGAQPMDARNGETRTRFAFDAPHGYPDTGPNWLTQWLDDDTVVIAVGRGGKDDLLECRFSTGACALALRVPAKAVMPEIG